MNNTTKRIDVLQLDQETALKIIQLSGASTSTFTDSGEDTIVNQYVVNNGWNWFENNIMLPAPYNFTARAKIGIFAIAGIPVTNTTNT
jgi:poly-beta-hydroxyalkanoate depolymerase